MGHEIPAAVGLGISIIFAFLRWAYPTVPRPVAWSGVIAGALIILLGLAMPHLNLTPASIGLFLIGCLCVGGAAYLAVVRSDRQVVPSAPTPVGATVPQVPQREFSKLTASQLLTIYNKPGLTNLQSAALVEPYYGLWLETEVSVISIYPDSGPKRTFGRFKEVSGGAEIECRFGPEWINQMSRLQTDDKFRVRGKLLTINGHITYLMDCEVA